MPDNEIDESKEPLTAKEKMNRNLLIGCMLIGGVIGGALSLVNPGQGFSAFSNNPVPTTLAVILALFWGIGLPVITLFWNRYIDEQEADAYRTGAYYGFMVYGIGAPVWWMLWRGGLVPEPNGVIIYYIVLMTCGVIWIRKKYG